MLGVVFDGVDGGPKVAGAEAAQHKAQLGEEGDYLRRVVLKECPGSTVS